MITIMLWQLVSVFLFFKSATAVKLYLSVEENQKPNSPVGNIVKLIINQTKAMENLKFNEFKLEMGKSMNFGHRNLISIDQTKGDIWIQSAIDREEICQQISKCDKGTFLDYLIIADSQVFELEIEIIDINDNYPTFQPDEKTLKIPEGIAKFTEFSLPVAKDKDSGKYGIKTYSLKAISSTTYEKFFELINHPNNHNPYLRVIDELDRESIKMFEFHLYAVDGGGNSGKCKITVEITDINDNTPQWIGLPYRKEISECTTENKIMQLVAQDKDDQQTEGGQVRYRISDNAPNAESIMRTFFITENTLYLNNGALKLFGQNRASIVVIAADGGARTNETTVELEIKDCNDNSPMIQIHSANLELRENEKLKIMVTMITVTDRDQGINSEFTCSLNDSNYLSLESIYHPNRDTSDSGGQKKIFKLNTVPGIAFDREKMSRHIVEIVCTDNGTPTMSSSERITIFIKDENDNAPVFDSQYKTFSIAEDAKIGSEVGRVIATDADSSPNNIVSYSIVGGDDVQQTFSITSFGHIQLSKNIDRETKDRYEFIVRATDSGRPTLNDSCQVRVVVLDVNDNAPIIAEKFHFKIDESFGQEQKHINIGKLNATDRDSGANGTFIFKARFLNAKQPIQVFNDGRLSIFGVIDREKSESMELQIDVIDNGYPPMKATTTVFIDIMDVNDNSPRFTFPSTHNNNHINITTDMPIGSVVATVVAVDPDKDANGTVFYSIVGTEASKKYFAIHNDGKIILNEKLSDKNRPDRLTIEARDNGTPNLQYTTNLYLRYPRKKNELFDSNGDNGVDSKYPPNLSPRKKQSSNNLSHNMVLLGFLMIAIVLILFGLAGIGIYMYCRGTGLHRMGDNGKHLPTNRDSNVAYQKGCAKNPTIKPDNLIDNEAILRNETYNQIGMPNFHQNYTNLMILKNNCCSPIENSYQFGHTLLNDNYSAFHRKASSPTLDKDHQEFTQFHTDEPWNQPKQIGTMQMRKKTFSESSDNLYEGDHKYAFIHGSHMNNFDMSPAELNNAAATHFTNPSQMRRSDHQISTRTDTNNPKLKINLVNSSFV